MARRVGKKLALPQYIFSPATPYKFSSINQLSQADLVLERASCLLKITWRLSMFYGPIRWQNKFISDFDGHMSLTSETDGGA